jgi:hypothetical protein
MLLAVRQAGERGSGDRVFVGARDLEVAELALSIAPVQVAVLVDQRLQPPRPCLPRPGHLRPGSSLTRTFS